MVMVPVTVDELRALALDGFLPGRHEAVAADQQLADSFGVPLGEEAEAAALQLADVLGLTAGGDRRLVLVAEPAADTVEQRGDQTVTVTRLPRDAVLAFFTGAAVPAAGRFAGLSLDAAWPLPEIQHMLASDPLQWHDLSELDAWLAEVGRSPTW